MRLEGKWWWEIWLLIDSWWKGEDHQEHIVIPPQTPINVISFSSSKSSNSGTPPRKMRSLDNLYEVTNHIDNDVTLYYYLATCDTIVFEKAINDTKWRIDMDEEIASIENNNIWKIGSYIKRKEVNRC